MKAWTITFIDTKDNVYTETYTRWNDIVFVRNNYEVLEMQETTV